MELITCFPVHKAAGFRMVGGGKEISSFASPNHDKICVNSVLLKNLSLLVMRKAVVRKS